MDLLATDQRETVPPRLDRMSSGMVVQDNALVRSAYTMTLLEKRLLMLAISKVNAMTAPKQGQPVSVEVSIEDWAEVYSETNPWRDLSKAADQLMGRIITIHPKDNNKRMRKKRMNWTDSCEYYDTKVVIQFGYSVSMELAGMLDEFTQVDLLDVAKLDSIYAVRLYEMIRQFTSTGELLITVGDFRQAMDMGKKYPRFSQLNQRVITQAVEDIKKKMPELNLDVEHIKRRGSRAVTSLKFIFKKSAQRDLFSDPNSSDNRENVTAAIMDIKDVDW